MWRKLEGIVAKDMDLSIFKAFANAIISGVWQIGTSQRGTVTGSKFTKAADLDVVLDEGASADINSTPEVLTSTRNSDLLVYVKPEQMPTIRANKLVSGYMLYDSAEGDYYEIIDVGIGKNQHTGLVEHLELRVVQTEVSNEQ